MWRFTLTILNQGVLHTVRVCNPSTIIPSWFDLSNSIGGKWKGKAIPVPSLDKAWGVQEVKIPWFQDSRHRKVVRLSALPTGGRLYSPGNIPGTYFCWRLSRPQDHNAAGRIMSITPRGIESATFCLVTQCLDQPRLCVFRYLLSHTNCKVHNM